MHLCCLLASLVELQRHHPLAEKAVSSSIAVKGDVPGNSLNLSHSCNFDYVDDEACLLRFLRAVAVSSSSPYSHRGCLGSRRTHFCHCEDLDCTESDSDIYCPHHLLLSGAHPDVVISDCSLTSAGM